MEADQGEIRIKNRLFEQTQQCVDAESLFFLVKMCRTIPEETRYFDLQNISSCYNKETATSSNKNYVRR